MKTKEKKIKRIALLISASNFERQKNFVTAVKNALQALGGYSLYVLTSYENFVNIKPSGKGALSIYQLLEHGDFDGCILESDLIGNHSVLSYYAKFLTEHNIPAVSVNAIYPQLPFVILDFYNLCHQAMEHLITVHGCKKINLVRYGSYTNTAGELIRAYQDSLRAHDIVFDQKRIINTTVSIENGKKIYDICLGSEEMNCDAVLFCHDVLAIGFYLRLMEVPESERPDIRIFTLFQSSNSIVFRPSISGVNQDDANLIQKACMTLHHMLENEPYEFETFLTGSLCLGDSCGCKHEKDESTYSHYQSIIVSKIETGNQIGQMLRYNHAMEAVTSLDSFKENIANLMKGIHCREYYICINESNLDYFISPESKADRSSFEQRMVLLCSSENTSKTASGTVFDLSDILPTDCNDGDFYLCYPLHNQGIVYGYIIIANELLPIEIYHYRICFESISASIENLHKQIIAQAMIKSLDELHMRDAMTNLYNRFALTRLADIFPSSTSFSVVMIDMDGLKVINDTIGHLAGNHAICLVSEILREQCSKEDIIIRYGGDEFLIVSNSTDPLYWENKKISINERLEQQRNQEQLSYQIRVSIGFTVFSKSDPSRDSVEKCIQIADAEMYVDKKRRKMKRS